MSLQKVEILPMLKSYIEQIFVFECDGPLPNDDLKLIVPNGRIKLVIPFKNNLAAQANGLHHLSKENKITLIGIADIPSTVEIEKNEPAGNITVEFSPLGAYRFLNLKWSDLKNTISDFSDISGNVALQLEEKLMNAPTIPAKLQVLQQFLVTLFRNSSGDPVFDFCVRKIIDSKGTINIKRLEKTTGYSARWLNVKFKEKIGTSPKNLASVIRFQQYYQYMAINADLVFMQKEFYNYYYDQSHFIKDFKRFTGHAPLRFEHLKNDYDSIFYKD